ncbi:D-(-)-3-hydroxybutyrate oligomer hydrolase [Lysobacter capsici]|uniref:D-(-)-3-hydroxybutyrate oligomer hydrolase n=1 Tax=Lysobacter capsici TaxID=435897 RepID=UPI001C006BDE|nr:D-(-)-3-hydroxybutyrate oligomer hydrolase [Lysobacter capsici]QWF19245.1 D-(-)-3-hydroxybutyrate oligomer hydrolase [Lysobacter capsici]
MSASILRTAAASAALILMTSLATQAAVAAKSRTAAAKNAKDATPMFSSQRQTEHRGEHDDLLTAGLGLDGLRAMVPPAFADAAHPTPAELRRRALWANWRGIADLAPGGGYGELYGSTAAVPGREYSAFATVAGASQPHRVLVQVPDAFDTKKRCVVVSASSGSRGIYGSIAVAGAWGLPKGCAVAYTDKGAGTDYFDLDAGMGVRADGTVGPASEGGLAFTPKASQREGGKGIAFKHAHSQDNPEADWGRHVRQAAQFALASLDKAFPEQAPFTDANTRVIAVGISNGGGAVLRAAELNDTPWLDAVVAGEPNVYVAGARPLYDYTTEAALLMPCALLHKPLAAAPVSPITGDSAESFCSYVAGLGLLGDAARQASTEVRAHAAYERMHANGWSDDALRAGALSVNFDLWRAVAATYASAYGRYAPAGQARTKDPDQPWVRYAYAAATPASATAPAAERAASESERAAWWSDASGIPPGAGVQLFGPAGGERLAPLAALRELWSGEILGGEAAYPEYGAALKRAHERVRAGIEHTRAAAPRKDLPIVVVHGLDDGLIPPAFSSAPYVAMARKAGAQVRYWEVRNVQHFDAFLGLPAMGARYLPLLPYVYAALDRVEAHLDRGTPLPADAVVANSPRAGKALTIENLAVPK